jgi:hypothetical protein
MDSRIHIPRGILGVEATESGVKVVQCNQALPQMLGPKEGRIVLQAAEQGVQIMAAFDLAFARNNAGNG